MALNSTANLYMRLFTDTKSLDFVLQIFFIGVRGPVPLAEHVR